MKKRYLLTVLSLLLLFSIIPVSTSANTGLDFSEDACLMNYYSCSNWTTYNYYYDCRNNDGYIVYQQSRECRDANGRVTIETREVTERLYPGTCPWGGAPAV